MSKTHFPDSCFELKALEDRRDIVDQAPSAETIAFHQELEIVPVILREVNFLDLICTKVLYQQQQKRVRVCIVDQLHKHNSATYTDQLSIHFNRLRSVLYQAHYCVHPLII